MKSDGHRHMTYRSPQTDNKCLQDTETKCYRMKHSGRDCQDKKFVDVTQRLSNFCKNQEK